jgi:hypothetical protein
MLVGGSSGAAELQSGCPHRWCGVATVIGMADQVRADPIELTRLGDQMLKSSQQIADGWRAAQGSLAIPAGAFGDTPAAATVAAEHASTVDDADLPIGRLVAVLENDMDALYRTAFAYQKADEEAERKFRQTHPHGPV